MLKFNYLATLAIALVPVTSFAQSSGTPDIAPPPPPAEGAEVPAPPPSEAPTPAATPEPTSSGAPAALAPTPEPALSASTEAPAVRSGPDPRSVVQPSPSGETGLLRVVAADASDPGLIRVGFGFEFFTLNDFFTTGDENTRVAGVLSVSGSPIDYVELWANLRATSNSNNLTSPNLLQSQGDLQLGIKGFYPVADLATVGVDAQITLLSGIGDAGYDFGASEARFRALLTADLRKAPEQIPLRAHLNAGIILDNSDNLLENGEELTNPERFALGVSEFNRVAIGAGIEVPVPYITPYVEYSVEFPIDYLATPGVVVSGRGLRTAQTDPVAENAVARPAVQRVIPQRLTPGVRVRPVDGLAIDVAVEIGLTPDQAVGVPAVPDYNVVTMLSYTLDPFATGSGPSGPPVAVPVIVPEAVGEARTGSRVAGLVTDKDSGDPVSGAIVSFGDGPPAATGDDGRFASTDLASGPVKMQVAREGYESGSAELTLVEGEDAAVEVSLVPKIVIGKVGGTVVDASGAPVPNASIRAAPAAGGDAKTLVAGADGRFAAELDAGEWRLTVATDGFLRTGRRIALEPKANLPDIALQLTPRGEVGAKVDGERLSLPEDLLYAKGETTPNATARRGLDLVVDLLLADATLKIEVGGHTDSRGNELDNREVSANRAEAARQYMLDRGVDPDQVTAEGYGASRPVAPNLTRSGRERNRRIDFQVR